MRATVSLTLKLQLAIAVCCLFAPQAISAQQTALEETADLSVFYDTAKVYPALTPRTYIKVGYGAIYDPSVDVFNPATPVTYVLQKVDEPLSIFIPERVDVASIRGEAQGVAYLYLDPKSVGLKQGDKLRLGIRVKHRTSTGDYKSKIIWNSGDPVTVPALDTYTLKLEPNVVPNQELKSGAKKTVGHLEFKLDVPSLIANSHVARFYFNTNNIFSTDSKDKTSQIEIKSGAERSLLNSWYVPGNAEAKLIGDQVFSNASVVLSSGTKTILPWRWTKPILFNSLVKAPISPVFEFSAQYENRLRQDIQARKAHPDKDTFRGFSQVAWNPIHLFTGKNFSPNDISLELLAKGWWFPFEKTAEGTRVRKFEGRLETSLLIPLGGLTISKLGGPLSFLKKPESGTNNRLRIKYTSGANEATGFKRSSEFTFGIEALK